MSPWTGLELMMKTLQANAKREPTRAINCVSGILVVGTEIEDVQMAEVRLMRILKTSKMPVIDIKL